MHSKDVLSTQMEHVVPFVKRMNGAVMTVFPFGDTLNIHASLVYVDRLSTIGVTLNVFKVTPEEVKKCCALAKQCCAFPLLKIL